MHEIIVISDSRTLTAAGDAYQDLYPPGNGKWKAIASHARNGTTMNLRMSFQLHNIANNRYGVICHGLQTALFDFVNLDREIPVPIGHTIRIMYRDCANGDAIYWSVAWERVE